MMFGLTMEKVLLIGLIAVLIIGPERLPAAAEALRRTVLHARRMARGAQDRVREELGSEVTDVDWQRLDPRRYDPRRIVREALLADPEPPASVIAAADPRTNAATPPSPPPRPSEAPTVGPTPAPPPSAAPESSPDALWR